MKKILKKIAPDFVHEFVGRYYFIKTIKSFSQKPILSIFKLMRWMFYSRRNADISFATPDGTRFISTSHNYSSFVVYFADYRDPAIQAFLIQKLKKGSVFVDAGANIGTYTIRASQIVGSQGKVIAIEAHPFTYTYLVKNIALNNLKNIIPINVALGSERGTVEMSYNPSNAGETHVAVGEEKRINVPLQTLDSILKESHETKIDYLKIDVEGFELPLLIGAKETITNNKNIIVQTELIDDHAHRYGHSITEVIDLLFSWGLAPHEIDDAGKSTALKKSELKLPGDVLWWRDQKITFKYCAQTPRV